MPLFVLISGFFSKPNKLSLSSIVKPLIIFQIINVLLLFILDGKLGWSFLLIPYWTLWYLLSLIFWRIILRYIPPQLLNRPYLVLGLAFILALFVGTFLPYGRILSIQRTISFFPFFMMGYYFKTAQIQQTLWNKNISYLFLSLISIYILLIGLPSNANVLLRGADSYSIHDVPAKLLMLCCTLILIYTIWNLKNSNAYLAKIGKDSLFYYLYHGLLIKFLIAPLVAKLGLPTTLWSSILYLFLFIILLHLMNKIKILRWLVNPKLKQKQN